MFTNKEYVYEVYKAKSFSKAAEAMFLSQPSLSATVKKVEKRLGVPLFDRSVTPIRLTECGEEYIKCVQQLMDIEDGFRSYLSDRSALVTGRLLLGASNFFVSYALPPLLTAFQKAHPGVDIHITETATATLERLLNAGEVDLIVDNNDFYASSFEKKVYFSEQLLLAVPMAFASNSRAEKSRLTLADVEAGRHLDKACPGVRLEHFRSDPFILVRPGNDSRDRADAMLGEAGVTARVILELDQLATAFHVCCQGMGAAFVSDSLVRSVKSTEVAYYRLDSAHARRSNYFYYRRNQYITRAMEAFLEMAGV